MWEEILKVALGNGLWAVLFCVLLMYQLRDGRARESKYRETINVLLEQVGTIDEVKRIAEESLVILRRRDKKAKKEEKAAEERVMPRTATVTAEAGNV